MGHIWIAIVYGTPLIESIDPEEGSQLGGQPMTIYGSGFLSHGAVDQVLIGDAQVTPTNISDSSLDVIIPFHNFDNLVAPPAAVGSGDVNSDGRLTFEDADRLVAYIFQGGVLSGQELLAADVNSDSLINISDVTLLISLVTDIFTVDIELIKSSSGYFYRAANKFFYESVPLVSGSYYGTHLVAGASNLIGITLPNLPNILQYYDSLVLEDATDGSPIVDVPLSSGEPSESGRTLYFNVFIPAVYEGTNFSANLGPIPEPQPPLPKVELEEGEGQVSGEPDPCVESLVDFLNTGGRLSCGICINEDGDTCEIPELTLTDVEGDDLEALIRSWPFQEEALTFVISVDECKFNVVVLRAEDGAPGLDYDDELHASGIKGSGGDNGDNAPGPIFIGPPIRGDDGDDGDEGTSADAFMNSPPDIDGGDGKHIGVNRNDKERELILAVAGNGGRGGNNRNGGRGGDGGNGGRGGKGSTYTLGFNLAGRGGNGGLSGAGGGPAGAPVTLVRDGGDGGLGGDLDVHSIGLCSLLFGRAGIGKNGGKGADGGKGGSWGENGFPGQGGESVLGLANTNIFGWGLTGGFATVTPSKGVLGEYEGEGGLGGDGGVQNNFTDSPYSTQICRTYILEAGRGGNGGPGGAGSLGGDGWTYWVTAPAIAGGDFTGWIYIRVDGGSYNGVSPALGGAGGTGGAPGGASGEEGSSGQPAPSQNGAPQQDPTGRWQNWTGDAGDAGSGGRGGRGGDGGSEDP